MKKLRATFDTFAEWTSLYFFSVMGGIALIALVYGIAWLLLA